MMVSANRRNIRAQPLAAASNALDYHSTFDYLAKEREILSRIGRENPRQIYRTTEATVRLLIRITNFTI